MYFRFALCVCEIHPGSLCNRVSQIGCILGRSVCDGMEDKIITLLIYVYLLILLQVLIRANVFFAICGKCLLKTKLIMAVLSCLLSRVRVVHG